MNAIFLSGKQHPGIDLRDSADEIASDPPFTCAPDARTPHSRLEQFENAVEDFPRLTGWLFVAMASMLLFGASELGDALKVLLP